MLVKMRKIKEKNMKKYGQRTEILMLRIESFKGSREINSVEIHIYIYKLDTEKDREIKI